MIEISTFGLFLIILGILVIPRITFFITWFYNASAVAAVLGGPAIVFSVIGVLILPKVVMTYLLLETLSGAPASGTFLYWAYLGLAFFFELGSKSAAKNKSSK